MSNAPNRPLRVLHALGASVDAGGVLSVVRALQSAPELQDIEQTVLVNERYDDVREPKLRLLRSKHIVAEAPTLALLKQSLRGTFELRRILAQNTFDVIHAHSRGALVPILLLSMVTGMPAVATHHAYARRTGLYRFAARRPNLRTVLLTPSMLRHYGLQSQPGRIDMVSACYSDDCLDRPLVPRDTFLNGNLRIVGVGSIVRWKNWGLLLQAIRLMPANLRPRVEFEHWGPVTPDADSRAFEQELYFKTKSYGLSEQVFWRGPTTKVLEKLNNASIFLLPSNHEPCSVALMEALALGLPAVVSQSGGNSDLVKDGVTGALFKMDDAQSLATTLTDILEGRVTFASPEAIRESVRRRCASVVAGEYRQIYEEMGDARRRLLGS